ncbi:MAG: hypothetical protein RSA70_04290, partial [Clostridia bacterium]
MNIVFVVDAYYPRYAAVEKCAKNLVDVLVNEGHDVAVIAKRYWDSPMNCTADLDERVYFVETPLSTLRSKVDARIAVNSASRLWRLADRGCAVINYALMLVGSSCAHRSLVDAYLSALESLDFVPDQLIPCSSPFDGVAACVEYCSVHKEGKLTPVLFDQFAESGTLCKTSVMRRFKRGANLRLERKALESSDVVFNVTWEEHVHKFHPNYKDKLVHIEHPLLVKPVG